MAGIKEVTCAGWGDPAARPHPGEGKGFCRESGHECRVGVDGRKGATCAGWGDPSGGQEATRRGRGRGATGEQGGEYREVGARGGPRWGGEERAVLGRGRGAGGSSDGS